MGFAPSGAPLRLPRWPTPLGPPLGPMPGRLSARARLTTCNVANSTEGQTCLHPASLNFCIPTIEPATIFPSAIARRRCCSLPGGRALGLGEAMGAVSSGNPRVQQLAGVDGHGRNCCHVRRAMHCLGEVWSFYWMIQAGGPAKALQQLAAASSITILAWDWSHVVVTPAQAVAFVMEFGLLETSRG